MEPKRKTIITKIWLNGNPVFSLNYMENKRDVYVDITGLRPDPTDYLKENSTYPARINFVSEKDYKNQDHWVLKSILVDGVDKDPIKFVNIR